MEKIKYNEFKKEYISNMTKDDIFYFLQDMYKEDLQKLLFGIDDSIFIEKISVYNHDYNINEIVSSDEDENNICYDYSYCIDNYKVSIGFDETGKVVYTNNFDKIIWGVDKKNEISKLIGKNILDLYKWLGVYCLNRQYYEYFYNCIFLDFYDKILSELKSNKKFEKTR